MDDTLLLEIEQYLARVGISATRFSELALGDRHFVRHLRTGRQYYPRTAAKVRTFMASAHGLPRSREDSTGLLRANLSERS